jgi:hypothetical protein
MLTLLYLENDKNAADVAIRVQALAAGEGQKIQVILKKSDDKKKHAQLKKTTTLIGVHSCKNIVLNIPPL